MTPRLLSVSNGYGEDLIAAEILRHLTDRDVIAYPLVGTGEAYPTGIERLEPRRNFPSGGFVRRAMGRALIADLRSGLIRFWLAQRRTLRAQRGRFTLALVVGDYYCLSMAALTATPAFLVASANSVLDAPYGPHRIRQLRQDARGVFTRDAPTATFLVQHGLNARYVGNVMVDCLRPTGSDLGIPRELPVVTLLPGSRADAPANAFLLLDVATRVTRTRPEVRFVLALARTVSEDAVAEVAARAGGTVRGGLIEVGRTRVLLTRAFADAVARTDLVVGLAGTANEQAAALGKPIVAFPGPGVQFTRAFLDLQRRLLGDAVVAVRSPAEAAAAVLRLLTAPEERARRGQVGKERMGEPGAAGRIAAQIQAVLTERT